MKERYIWITPDFHDELEEAEVRDGEKVAELRLQLHLSAYDIPKSVKGFRTSEEFVVEFDYIDSEPLGKKVVPDAGGITFVEGRHSGRLMQIRINLRLLKIQDARCIVNLKPTVIDAIDERAGFHAKNRDSFDAAKKVIKRSFADLVGTG